MSDRDAPRVACSLGMRGVEAVCAIAYAVASITTAGAWADDDARIFARAESLSLPALSPDGATLSYVAHSAERQAVVLRALADGDEQRTLQVEPRRERIRWCGWSESAHLLCGTVLPVRAPDCVYEKTRLYAIERVSGRPRELLVRPADQTLST